MYTGHRLCWLLYDYDGPGQRSQFSHGGALCQIHPPGSRPRLWRCRSHWADDWILNLDTGEESTYFFYIGRHLGHLRRCMANAMQQ